MSDQYSNHPIDADDDVDSEVDQADNDGDEGQSDEGESETQPNESETIDVDSDMVDDTPGFVHVPGADSADDIDDDMDAGDETGTPAAQPL